MSLIHELSEEIQKWDKLEGASAVYWMFGWNKKKEDSSSNSEKSLNTEESMNVQNEDENDDYRDDTQGDRNAKYLKKARIKANTPQARLKRERTEFKKELNRQ